MSVPAECNSVLPDPSRWATGCTGIATAPIISNSETECCQRLYWWA
ncbi:hypothetical protein [Streptomyces xanthophaeus]